MISWSDHFPEGFGSIMRHLLGSEARSAKTCKNRMVLPLINTRVLIVLFHETISLGKDVRGGIGNAREL
jgi:hypothetical protein